MKVFVTLLFIISVSSIVLADEKIRYDNHKVYRVTPKTKQAAEVLHSLEEYDGFDFWSGVTAVNHPVDIMVPPYLNDLFNRTVYSSQFDTDLFIPDVQKLIDNENPAPNKRAVFAYDWTSYQTLDEINDWLRNLAQTDSRVTLVRGGSTHQGREILGVRLVFASGNQRRSVFIEGNIHAREWITNAVATWIINELLTSTNQGVRALAASRDWYIFPVVNPDGFVYSIESQRLWRKTRVPYGNAFGADPNRNWGYHYNQGGTSNSPSSETYRGPYAFSEPCTKTLSEYLTTIGSNLEAFISLHSYSQLLLLPYGDTTAHLDNYNELITVGRKAIQSLASRYGTVYQVGNIPEVLYVASGGSMDWVKGTFGTRITYTYELRDTGRYGFILPANQIIPTALETFDSIVTIFSEFDQIYASEKKI